MEGMNLSTIKKLVEGKRVWIKKDNEYQFFKCVIKTAEHDGCICQLDNGKVIKFHYGQLQAFRTVIELDRQEFNFWCVEHKEMLQKAVKDKGKNPKGAINDIYNKAKDYFSDAQLNDLRETFENLGNTWETHSIDTYYEAVKEMLK